MLSIKVLRRHNLTPERMKVISEQIADELKQEFGIRWDWEGSRLVIHHTGASGYLHATEDSLKISLQLGFSLCALKPIIEAAIIERVDEILIAEDR